jgi:methyltransferase family protein
MPTNNWKGFWDKYLLTRYGKEEVQSEDDLYLQVARTVNRKPIDKQAFNEIIELITNDLTLLQEDILVDFCCGNGLFTYELKGKVKEIIGVDFSQSIIDTANKYKSAHNITYCMGSTVEFLKDFNNKWPGLSPTKYLMNDALAYFTPVDLENMLSSIVMLSPEFKFLIRGVPNDLLKWNYYNTDQRKQVYFDNLAKGDTTNDGLGSWWVPDDIAAICSNLKLSCFIQNQLLPISDYRMDILIAK